MQFKSIPVVSLSLTAALLCCSTAYAAQKPFDCKTKSRIPFTATINWAGTMNRAIQVTFQSRPSAAEATSVVQACVKLAVSTDGANDAHGSVWVGEDAVKLTKGTAFAYLAKDKSYKFM